MNHRAAMCKILQRTCLALNYTASERPTNALGWRFCYSYKQYDSLCSFGIMMTPKTTKWHISKRFYTNRPHHPTSKLVPAPQLCEEKAYELILNLKDAERLALKAAMDKYEAIKIKEGYEAYETRFYVVQEDDHNFETSKERIPLEVEKSVWDKLRRLAESQWRSKFGRLSKVPPPLSNVDPSGAFCTFPENWLQKRAEEYATPPSTADLSKIFFVNTVPFIVFGFLDNFIMIMAGDYIEQIFGAFMCLSIMAAAGLGNTISDMIGIGSAFYVERVCAFLGLRPPDLKPIQFEMKKTRRAANLGRLIGIAIGCLLGMTPLLFIDIVEDEKIAEEKRKRLIEDNRQKEEARRIEEKTRRKKV